METQTSTTEADNRATEIEQHLAQVRAVSAQRAEILRKGAEQLTEEDLALEELEEAQGTPSGLALMKYEAVETMLGLLATLRGETGDTRITVRTRLGEVHLVRAFEHDGENDTVPRDGYRSIGFFDGAFHGLVDAPILLLWRVLHSSDERDAHLAIYHAAGDSPEPERVVGVDLEWISCWADDMPMWDLVVGQSDPGVRL